MYIEPNPSFQRWLITVFTALHCTITAKAAATPSYQRPLANSPSERKMRVERRWGWGPGSFGGSCFSFCGGPGGNAEEGQPDDPATTSASSAQNSASAPAPAPSSSKSSSSIQQPAQSSAPSQASSSSSASSTNENTLKSNPHEPNTSSLASQTSPTSLATSISGSSSSSASLASGTANGSGTQTGSSGSVTVGNTSPHRLTHGVVAGLAVLAVLLLVCMTIFSVMILRRRRRNRRTTGAGGGGGGGDRGEEGGAMAQTASVRVGNSTGPSRLVTLLPQEVDERRLLPEHRHRVSRFPGDNKAFLSPQTTVPLSTTEDDSDTGSVMLPVADPPPSYSA